MAQVASAVLEIIVNGMVGSGYFPMQNWLNMVSKRSSVVV